MTTDTTTPTSPEAAGRPDATPTPTPDPRHRHGERRRWTELAAAARNNERVIGRNRPVLAQQVHARLPEDDFCVLK